MIDLHILLVLVSVLVSDALGLSRSPDDGVWALLVLAISVPALVIAVQHVWITVVTRKLISSGQPVWIDVVRRVQWLGASIGVGAFLISLFGFGLLGWVRQTIGDWVLLDEVVVVSPALGVIVSGWWSGARLEQVLRDAVVMQRMDAGQEVHPPLTRAGIVKDRLRHRASMVVLPVALLVGWSETVWLVSARASRENWGGLTGERIEQIAGAMEFGSVVVLVVFLPVMLRLIWRTSELGTGPVRDRVLTLCRVHGVRVRHILVWWTHGTMINGAVVGVLGWTRSILLTDELLACLSDAQVEAVMAHEVAHIKRRHIQWMLFLLAGGLMGLGAIADLIERVQGLIVQEADADVVIAVQGVMAGAGLGVLVMVFGVVSRRFERQADAFAVQHGSGLSNKNPRGFGLVGQPEAVDAMSGSLEHIAVLNGIQKDKRMFRHGSIGSRVRALRALEGVPLDHFPIDMVVRRTKRGILLGVVAAGVVIALGYVFLPVVAQETVFEEAWVVSKTAASSAVIPINRNDLTPSGGE